MCAKHNTRGNVCISNKKVNGILIYVYCRTQNVRSYRKAPNNRMKHFIIFSEEGLLELEIGEKRLLPY